MVRSSANMYKEDNLKKHIKNLELINIMEKIYESKGGQNQQMLIPVAYKYICGYIDEPLFNCLVRNDSHSREYIS